MKEEQNYVKYISLAECIAYSSCLALHTFDVREREAANWICGVQQCVHHWNQRTLPDHVSSAAPNRNCMTQCEINDKKERKQTTPTAYHLAMARSEKKYSTHGHMAYGHDTGNKSHLGRILLLVLARIQSIGISNMLPFFKILWIIISTFNNQRARPMCVRSRHFQRNIGIKFINFVPFCGEELGADTGYVMWCIDGCDEIVRPRAYGRRRMRE